MIPYNDIRKVWVQGLKVLLKLDVINMNGGADMPKTAFLAYNLFPNEEPSSGRIMVSQHNGKQLLQETVNFTVSFLSYADDNVTSTLNAMRVRDWFKTDGREALKDMDVIVTSIGNVENRDINIGPEWERRMGFDVELRTTDTTEQAVIPIEKANIKRS
ncbi:phage neck terminator protein [Paenibacillus sp. SAF-054]|uniref:phage neck terminator protein n=1 Tax=unclassified Paenibacillus TaxID=185978 RepID=UPI003F81012F